MATRSFIAHEVDAGWYQAIYCHYDGYPDGVGSVLLEHYSASKQVADLLEHGDVSYFRLPDAENASPVPIYYGRDKGEVGEHNRRRSFRSESTLMAEAAKCGCEYVYLFDGLIWLFAERGPQYFGCDDGTSFGDVQWLTLALELAACPSPTD